MFITAVCFLFLIRFDQTTMTQEQKCVTSLSFDLIYFWRKSSL